MLAGTAPALLALLWVGSAIIFDLLQAIGLMPTPDPDLQPPALNWASALTRVCALLTLGALATSAAAYRRARRGACPHCGRTSGDIERQRPTWWVAVLAAAVSLPYMVIKAHWSLGGTIGLEPGAHLDLTFLAGWGTVLMEAVGTPGCLALALVQWWGYRVPHAMPIVGGPAVPRPLVLVPGWIGAALLITTSLPSFIGVLVARFSGVDSGHAVSAAVILKPPNTCCGYVRTPWIDRYQAQPGTTDGRTE